MSYTLMPQGPTLKAVAYRQTLLSMLTLVDVSVPVAKCLIEATKGEKFHFGPGAWATCDGAVTSCSHLGGSGNRGQPEAELACSLK